MTDKELDASAREYIAQLVDAGLAVKLVETWYDHNQSCGYIYDIVTHGGL